MASTNTGRLAWNGLIRMRVTHQGPEDEVQAHKAVTPSAKRREDGCSKEPGVRHTSRRQAFP